MENQTTDPRDTLTGLLECYSPSGKEREAVEWLVARMQVLGYERTFIDPGGNAIGIIGKGERQILLLGHIDTVPGEIPVLLQTDQLYGRGSVDAKGSLATFVHAVANIGSIPGWQLIVIGAVDKERDSLGARYVMDQYKPNFAIIGEPSGWKRITLGYKGSAYAEVTVQRPQAHGAAQQKTACEAAFIAWASMHEWVSFFNQDRQRLFDRLLVSLNKFSSGTDHFENWAKLSIGARLPLDYSPTEWYAKLGDFFSPGSVDPVGYPIPAYRCEKNTPLVRAFLSGIRKQGGKPGFRTQDRHCRLEYRCAAVELPLHRLWAR